jgi:opacity protein-like surface antigen
VRYTLFVLTFMVLYAPVRAQNFFVNIDAGVANYDGELQQHRYSFQEAHPGGGLGIGYEFSPHFNLSTGFLYTKISGADKNSTNIYAQDRNLSFATSILEWNLRAEYVLFDLEDRPLSPYVFGGLAVFHFNPYADDISGQKTYLRPLSTEGEGLEAGRPTYSLTQMAIPFGLGVRLALSDNVRVGLEIGVRKTFTGYLDDVHGTYVNEATLLAAKGPEAVQMAFRENELPTHSGQGYPPEGFQRGTGKDDWYYFTGLRISFRIGGASYTHNHLTCPKRIL